MMIDARGMLCPWPAIRLSRALRQGAVRLDILADDPKAAKELEEVATAAGWAFAGEDGRFSATPPA